MVELPELSAEVVEFMSAGTLETRADDGQLAFNTGCETSKGRALKRDSRVMSCVRGNLGNLHPPYSFVHTQVGAT
jgi:hypothetical protein